jgi:ankyrin repeat protein
LLQDKRVDPGAVWNSALRSAAYEGHLEVVRLLLREPRVDPRALGCYALNWACSRGHLSVVKEILQVSISIIRF